MIAVCFARRSSASQAREIPNRFVLLGVTATSADRVNVLLRDEHFIGDFAQAKRHADLIAAALTQYHRKPCEGQVIDALTGLPLYVGGAK